MDEPRDLKTKVSKPLSQKDRILQWSSKHRYIKYVVVSAVFVIFTLLLGDASLFRHYRYSQRIHTLEQKLKATTERYKQDSIRLQEIRSNKDGVEHIAREQFLMKRANEMIFIISDTTTAESRATKEGKTEE